MTTGYRIAPDAAERIAASVRSTEQGRFAEDAGRRRRSRNSYPFFWRLRVLGATGDGVNRWKYSHEEVRLIAGNYATRPGGISGTLNALHVLERHASASSAGPGGLDPSDVAGWDPVRVANGVVGWAWWEYDLAFDRWEPMFSAGVDWDGDCPQALLATGGGDEWLETRIQDLEARVAGLEAV